MTKHWRIHQNWQQKLDLFLEKIPDNILERVVTMTK